MTQEKSPDVQQQIGDIYRRESRRVFATLVRLVSDFDLAEEMLHEAFSVAIERWPVDGVPQNPYSWLVSTGRFKAIDAIRRRTRFAETQPDLATRLTAASDKNQTLADADIADDRLRLIFTCCHPAIDPNIQVPLTLREVCGLTTEEIAAAFLVPPATMAQRIVRGKAKIRAAGIPYVVPALADVPERLDSVLAVIYLVFNEGYSASAGDNLTRSELSADAIQLARLVLELQPDSEVMGLLALMLLHESRRPARMTSNGDIILLDAQDRSLWDRDLIVEGQRLVEQAMANGRIGGYTIQAAISAVHASAASPAETDWPQIVLLYDVLARAEPSPIVDLNRAVAVAMRDGPAAGLQLIDAILERGDLTNYHLAHSARAELLQRLGKPSDARIALQRAMNLTKQEPERRFLAKKLAQFDDNATNPSGKTNTQEIHRAESQSDHHSNHAAQT